MGKRQRLLNIKNSQTRQEFLHTFFEEELTYEEKMVNSFWLVKHWSEATHSTQVAIFKPLEFTRYKEYREKIKALNEKQGTLFVNGTGVEIATPQP